MLALFQIPFFKAGFRPFFFAAMLAGVALPWIWLKVLFGGMDIRALQMSSVAWHVHEMYFGFGMAVLGGFLLTATKNWVKIRGIHGGALFVLVMAWLVERAVMWGIIVVSTEKLRLVLQNIFLIMLVFYLLMTLIRFRKQDSFKDNFYFLIILPTLVIAKLLLLTTSDHKVASDILVGVFRVAFAVMFERTITQFMKNSRGLELLRNPYLDHSIKGLLVLLLIQTFLPTDLGSALSLIAGILFIVRGVIWKPVEAFRNFGIGIMYVGYFSLGIHLILAAFEQGQWWNPLGTMAQHWFSFFVMGVIIPAMFIRIIQGHTGRKILFTFTDKLALWAMILGGSFRTIIPQLWSEAYHNMLYISAVCWSLCFLLIFVRLSPYLFADRIDGKEH